MDFNESTMTFEFPMEDAQCCSFCWADDYSRCVDDDCHCHEPEQVPAKFDLCPLCSGRGRHSLSVDGHGITQSEWENDWSFEEQETYLRGGYDSTCEECQGKRVIPVVDWDSITSKTLRSMLEDHFREEAEYRQMVAMERKYGA